MSNKKILFVFDRKAIFKIYYWSILVVLFPIFFLFCVLADADIIKPYIEAFKDADQLYRDITK